MADYPTLRTLADGSVEEWRDPKAVRFSRSNSAKARMLSSARKTNFTLHHILDGTDYTTLKTFYDANRALTFTYTWSRLVGAGIVITAHTVIFGENNIQLPLRANGIYDCTVQLLEV